MINVWVLSLGIYLTVLVCLQYIPGPGEGVYSVDYTRPICSSLPESLQVPNLYICLSLFPQAIDACRMKEGRGGEARLRGTSFKGGRREVSYHLKIWKYLTQSLEVRWIRFLFNILPWNNNPWDYSWYTEINSSSTDVSVLALHTDISVLALHTDISVLALHTDIRPSFYKYFSLRSPYRYIRIRLSSPCRYIRASSPYRYPS